MLGLAIALGGAIALQPPPAFAEPQGAFQSAALRITDDGTSSAPGDESNTDGKVAVGGQATFSWAFVVNGLKDAQISQTLPKGWTWNESSLRTAGMMNVDGVNGYTSSFALTDDGRTVTVTLSGSGQASDSQLIEFNYPAAMVSGTDADLLGSVYEPELTVTDAGGSRTIGATGTPSSLEVVGLWQGSLTRATFVGENHGVTTCDFGDGAEPAYFHGYSVIVRKSANPDGTYFDWKTPVRVTASYGFTQGGVTLDDLKNQVSVVSASNRWDASGAPTATIENLDTSAHTFDIVIEGSLDEQVAVRMQQCIPLSQVPDVSAGEQKIRLQYDLAPVDWFTSDGHPVENTSPPVSGIFDFAYDNGDASVASGPKSAIVQAERLDTVIDPTRQFVHPGTSYRHRLNFTPAYTSSIDGGVEITPTSGVNLFSFWNPSETNIVDPELVTDGTGERLVSGTDYVVYVTTEDGSEVEGADEALDIGWTPLSEFAGDLRTVSGVRYEYIGNGGVWVGADTSVAADSELRAYPLFTVVRDAPNLADDSEDTGDVYHRALFAGDVHDAEETRVDVLALDRVVVRGATGTIPQRGVVLTQDGEVQQPETVYALAGQSVRYTLEPQVVFTNIHGYPSSAVYRDIVIPNVVVTDVLPANLLPSSLDFSRLDTEKWSYEIETNIDDAGSTRVTFRYLGEAKYYSALEPIEFDARTSSVAPAGGVFVTKASIRADTLFPSDSIKGTMDTEFTMHASQPNVALVEKSSTTPVIEGDESAQYTVSWFNFLSVTQQETKFVDVLPYHGDGRGTDVTGPVVLRDATMDAVDPSNVELQLTTDPAVRSAPSAPADQVAWIAYDAASEQQIASATALRILIRDFTPGPDSVGTLRYTLDLPDAENGERIDNTVSGALMNGKTLIGEGEPVEVAVVRSVVEGRVWDDRDGNGRIDPDEPFLEGATVTVTDAAGKTATATTDADGVYRVGRLVSGEYVVSVDADSLPSSDGQWVNTFSPAGGGDGVSGTITVAQGTTVSDQDFGYRAIIPAMPALPMTGVGAQLIALLVGLGGAAALGTLLWSRERRRRAR